MSSITVTSTAGTQGPHKSAREPIVVTASAKAMPTTTKFSSDHWVVYKRKLLPAQSTRPTCTHITMRRTFSRTCQVCPNLFPNDYYGMSTVPWVYVCDADHAPSMENSFPATPVQQKISLSADPLNEDATIAKLYSVGLSQPIITLVKQDFYTKDQIDTLIAQRLHVKEVIASETATLTPEASMPNASAPAIVETSESRVVEAQEQVRSRVSTIIRSPPGITSKCTQTGCPRCRPHFRERACVSFEAVFAGEIPAILPSEVSDLPIADVAIVRKLGQRVSRSQMVQSSPTDSSNMSLLKSSSPSTTTLHTSSSSGLEMKERTRRTRVFYSLRRTATSSTDGTSSEHQRTAAISAGLRLRYQQLKQRWSRKNDGNSSSPGVSRVTLPLSGTGALRGFHGAAEDFDLFHLRRKPIIVGGSELDMAGSTDATMHDSLAGGHLLSANKEAEVNGSEVEVDGGVALTEEAVENHTPDVITQI